MCIFKYKEIFYPLLLSFIVYCYQYAITCILLFIDDNYLFFIPNKIHYISNSIESESDLDSDSDSESETQSESEIQFDSDLNEYKNILELFNIINNFNNIEQLYKKTFISNIIINSNEIYIVNSFLFNFNNEKNIIDLTDIFPFTKKLCILYNIYNKFNSNHIQNLNLPYRYLYILYKNSKFQYKYGIIDLDNNIQIINNKKLLFNNIRL